MNKRCNRLNEFTARNYTEKNINANSTICMHGERGKIVAQPGLLSPWKISRVDRTGYKAHLAYPCRCCCNGRHSCATLFYKLSGFTRELIGLKQRALIGIGVRVTIAMHSNKLSAIGKATTRTRMSRLPGTWCRTKSNLTRNETGLTIKCARVPTLRTINFSLSLLRVGTV